MHTKVCGESSFGMLYYFTGYDYSWWDVRRILDYHTSVMRSVCLFCETSLQFVIVTKPVWRFTAFQLLQLLCTACPRKIQVYALTVWNFNTLTPRSMSPSWEADNPPACKEFPAFHWKAKIQYHMYRSQPPAPDITFPLNSVFTLWYRFFLRAIVY
jgi:hypothetical protein